LLDGWSGAQLLQELLALYKSLRHGESVQLERSRPYGDYIGWLQRQDNASAESFWRKMLAGFTVPTPLCLDRTFRGTLQQAERHDRQEITLTAALTAELARFGRRHQLTLNTLVQGAWALLLSRYSGQRDVLFGATVSGRPAALPGVESILGNFINTLPVRVSVNPDARLAVWLRELQRAQVEMRQYEYSPLVQIQRWSEVPGTLPLFESLIVFENYPTQSAFSPASWHEQAQLSVSDIRSDDLINFPLAIGAEPGPDSTFRLRMVYDARRFDDATIARMLGHLRRALEEFTRDAERPLKALTFSTDEERRQLLFDWNDTRRDYSSAVSILELFAQQAQQTPESIAVCFGTQTLTYRQLDSATNKLAHRLRRMGTGPDVLVGIYMERSLEMVLAIIGTLKAGGAYVPFDPSYPRARLSAMLDEARPAVLLTQGALVRKFPEKLTPVIALDTDWDSMSDEPDEPLAFEVSGTNLAYVIYTSGSTGKPKGVMNTHEAILNRLLWMQEIYQLSAADRVLQKTPFSFDVSVWEFLWPLVCGARLVVAEPGGHQDSSYLLRVIAEEQITIVHFVPSMLRVFLAEQGLEACTSLRHVICSGEALPVELEKRFFERMRAELHNLYGPTEAAIDVTFWRCERDNQWPNVPIGRPIANTQIYLLDEELEPVPVGVRGELHIGGVGLARGYYERAGLTAEKFIPDPFAAATPGARLYKTGDIARYRPDGCIEFLGRADAQVKLRGFRIELGEIESVLSCHENVRDAVVLAREDTPGDKRLVAYLVAAPGASISIADVRGFLQTRLPDYMLPAAYVCLETFPLTTSGKIDRRQLPPPDEDRAQLTAPLIEPRTPIEIELAAMWRELLGAVQVGVDDNFFELGGHSLMLTQLASRINDAFQVQLPLRVLFNVPTIALMTTAIAARQMEQADPLQLAAMLDELDNFTDDEIQKLLEAESGMSL
ncbi:MAG TPA: amino acid adenylation domain-containing protein, partial [Pyrinomonadaceae bacterium]